MPRLEAPVDDDLRRRRRVDARFDGIPQQVAERLPQQHVVAFDDRKLPVHDHVAAMRPRLASHFVGGALGDRAHVDRREHQLLGPREVEEVGDHLAQRFGLLPDAPEVRMIAKRAAP